MGQIRQVLITVTPDQEIFVSQVEATVPSGMRIVLGDMRSDRLGSHLQIKLNHMPVHDLNGIVRVVQAELAATGIEDDKPWEPWESSPIPLLTSRSVVGRDLMTDQLNHEPTACTRDTREDQYFGKGYRGRFVCPVCGKACRQHLNFLGRRSVVCDGVKFTKEAR